MKNTRLRSEDETSELDLCSTKADLIVRKNRKALWSFSLRLYCNTPKIWTNIKKIKYITLKKYHSNRFSC